jgi:hypothetical protein
MKITVLVGYQFSIGPHVALRCVILHEALNGLKLHSWHTVSGFLTSKENFLFVSPTPLISRAPTRGPVRMDLFFSEMHTYLTLYLTN